MVSIRVGNRVPMMKITTHTDANGSVLPPSRAKIKGDNESNHFDATMAPDGAVPEAEGGRVTGDRKDRLTLDLSKRRCVPSVNARRLGGVGALSLIQCVHR
ncbi:membrane protein [Anopheles sinensis]|uniref:Membrane protein n=1 Tax=Anopheles sinensis TaxID=74873 RepID=A0A084WA48_ANOSI|nr:membrane protein [Anopheles sinensis]